MSENPDRPEYPERYYAQLLFFARGDLEWARSRLERTTHFYHKPCFEAREAVEKTLKAFWKPLAVPRQMSTLFVCW